MNLLITGANRGLGLALARQFAPLTKQLFLVVRTAQAEQALLNEFSNATVLIADVSDAAYPAKLKQALGEIALDIVINNAGTAAFAPTLAETTTEAMTREFSSHCLGTLHTAQACIHALLRAKSPVMFNISSRFGSISRQAAGKAKAVGCSYSYRAAKAAQNMITLALIDEFPSIDILAVHPGRLLTDIAASDAHLTPEESALRLKNLYLNSDYKSGEFISLEGGSFTW